MKLIITIDGPAGSGKSTIARLLAKERNLPYIDTGAMYRALTLVALQRGLLKDKSALERLTRRAKISFESHADENHTRINGRDVTNQIRQAEVTQNVHYLAGCAQVRGALLGVQRRLAKAKGGVMEGRDIGTVVFPQARHKFYLNADVDIRARRRFRELVAHDPKATLKRIKKEIVERDYRDMHRKVAPLSCPLDAVILDSTSLTIPEVVATISGFISFREQMVG